MLFSTFYFFLGGAFIKIKKPLIRREGAEALSVEMYVLVF
jgi:hypothetical protein